MMCMTGMMCMTTRAEQEIMAAQCMETDAELEQLRVVDRQRRRQEEERGRLEYRHHEEHVQHKEYVQRERGDKRRGERERRGHTGRDAYRDAYPYQTTDPERYGQYEQQREQYGQYGQQREHYGRRERREQQREQHCEQHYGSTAHGQYDHLQHLSPYQLQQLALSPQLLTAEELAMEQQAQMELELELGRLELLAPRPVRCQEQLPMGTDWEQMPHSQRLQHSTAQLSAVKRPFRDAPSTI
jgi:hypothetical protein